MTSNLTHHDGPVECATGPNFMAITIIYLLIFPIALIINGVAAWVSLRLRSTSTFMVYLKNLVAADLLMTLTFLINAVNDLAVEARQLHVFVCRHSAPVFYTCMYINIALMGLISLDRFFKIIRPCGKLLGQNLIFGKLMSALVWVILFGSMAIPNMILTDQPANSTGPITCMSLKGPVGIYYHGSIVIIMNGLFWCVSVLVVACYICIAKKVIQSFRNSGSTNSQGQKKTKLRVFLVLVLFFVCFGPYHIVRVPYTLLQTKGQKGCPRVWARFAKAFTQWLSSTNVCLDPLLYFFLCREFREKLISMMNNMGIRSPRVAAEGRTENISP